MNHDSKTSLATGSQINLASYFLDVNMTEGRGDRIALYYNDASYTYSNICTLTNKVGNALRNLGVEIENRIFIALNDSPEFVAVLHATAKIGATFRFFYTYSSIDDYQYEINLLKPKVIVADSSCIERLRVAAKNNKYPKAFLVVGLPSSELQPREYDFYSVVNNSDENLEPELTHKDDLVKWAVTGGSTGRPKAVPASHGLLVQNFNSLQEIVHYNQNDIVLPIPKLFFGYACTGTIIFPFRVGASSVLFPERTTPERVFQLIERYKPTILLQVPTMMRKMLQTPKEKWTDLSSVRLCFSAGEPLSEDLYYEWKSAFGIEAVDAIGSAEMGYLYLSNRPGDAVPGSVGKALPGIETRVVDDNGNDVADGEIGVLMTRGADRPASACYYLYDNEKSWNTFRGEWIYTGDLFFRDLNGYFHFAGRKDDLLKVSGYWLSPLEIEKCLQSHPDVADCAVVGIKSVDNLDIPKAFVELVKDMPANETKANELKDYTKKKLSPYKYPRIVEFIDILPKNKVGKIDRALLKQRGI
jgi:benzoate-CoA ligase family protein